MGGDYRDLPARELARGGLAVSSWLLGLELRLEEGRLRLWDVERERYLATPDEDREGREAAEKRVEAAEKRVEAAARRVAESRATTVEDQVQAEAATRQAAEEQAAAEAAARRAAESRAQAAEARLAELEAASQESQQPRDPSAGRGENGQVRIIHE